MTMAVSSLVAACLGLAGYLMFHSIPGTGALRSLFLLLLFTGVAAHTWRTRPRLSWPPLDATGYCLALLTAWLWFQSAFLAVDGPEPLRTFGTEWPKNLLIAACGIWLARSALQARKGDWVIIAVFCGFFAQVLCTLGYQIWHLLARGYIDYTASLFANYGYVSPLVDAALAIAAADAAGRICFRRRLLPLGPSGIAATWTMLVLALLALGSKASWINAIVMEVAVAATAAACVPRYRQRILALALGAAVCIIALGVTVQGRVQGHWSGAIDSIRYGHALEASNTWKGSGEKLPKHFNESFYLRAAWGTAGWQGLMEHPLGRGYGSNAFGRFLAERYGVQGAVSSHSGWLDFALANGIPGLVLLLALSTALCIRGWQSFLGNTGVGGLALSFLTLAYISRCLIDGQISTSKLMAFALVSGVTWGLSRDADTVRETYPA